MLKTTIITTKEFKIGDLPTVIVKYDNNGRIIYRKDIDGVEETIHYDKLGRLVLIENSEGFRWPYSHKDPTEVGYPRFPQNCYEKIKEHISHNGNFDDWTRLASSDDCVILHRITNHEDIGYGMYEERIECYLDANVIRYYDSEGEVDDYFDCNGSRIN